jgi:hypothetical protein
MDWKEVQKAERHARREGFNRGVRAAAKVAWATINPYITSRGQAQSAAKAILKLVKPVPKR